MCYFSWHMVEILRRKEILLRGEVLGEVLTAFWLWWNLGEIYDFLWRCFKFGWGLNWFFFFIIDDKIQTLAVKFCFGFEIYQKSSNSNKFKKHSKNLKNRWIDTTNKSFWQLHSINRLKSNASIPEHSRVVTYELNSI